MWFCFEASKTGSCPDSLKCANVRPIYKKVKPFYKTNYRPVSILPILSKFYERVIYKQALNSFKPFFNEILCGFRKVHLNPVNSWQNSVNRGEFVASILMDLSEAFNCLKNDLLLAKIQSYGFSKESIILFLSYLTNCTQRIKIGSTFSDWTNSVFHKVLCWAPYFLIFLSMICSFSQPNMKCVTLLMTIAFIFLWYGFR